MEYCVKESGSSIIVVVILYPQAQTTASNVCCISECSAKGWSQSTTISSISYISLIFKYYKDLLFSQDAALAKYDLNRW